MSDPDFKPFIYQLPKVSGDIFVTSNEVIESRYQAQPLFKLGFNYYIHQTKDKMAELDDPKYKGKKFHRVINDFEHMIPDYKDDIANTSIKYFNLGKAQPDIISRAFYKLWEILMTYNLVPNEMSNFVSAHIAEGPGSFVQCMMYFREKFSDSKHNKSDKYCAITLHSNNKSVPAFNKKFVNCYTKTEASKVVLHKTYSTSTASKSKAKDNGDITNPKTIRLFKEEVKKTGNYAHIVTADGGFVWNDENYQEQEAYRLILAEMIAALSIQRKGGHFICKFFDTFTDVSIKYLHILQQFYENVTVHKPLMSRKSNSERYIIASKFKYDQGSKLDKMIKQLESVLERGNQFHKKGTYISDIFPDFPISKNLYSVVKHINIQLSTVQHVQINKIMKYIHSGNYFGNVYHSYLDLQRKASDYWLQTYYPITIKDAKINKEQIQQQATLVIEENKKKIEELRKTMI